MYTPFDTFVRKCVDFFSIENQKLSCLIAPYTRAALHVGCGGKGFNFSLSMCFVACNCFEIKTVLLPGNGIFYCCLFSHIVFNFFARFFLSYVCFCVFPVDAYFLLDLIG